MFAKTLAIAFALLAASAQVSAHALVAPPLGVTGTPARSDVQRPSAANVCGSEQVSALSTSTAVTANGNTVTLTATNFNAGEDGSRQFTAKVDASGTGKNLVAATITKNGDLAPTNVGSQQITMTLPAGTKCTGGSSGDLCLAQFISASGFGSCVAIKQGGAAASGAAASGSGAAAAGGKAKGGKGAKKNGRAFPLRFARDILARED